MPTTARKKRDAERQRALADRSLLTADEVALLMHVSTKTVWRLRSAGKLRGRKVGFKAVRFKREDVEKLIERG
jgi:excisionase family DNA binding protein